MPESAPEFRTGSPRRIIAVANQKGGVGKTTTAINLASALAALAIPVLLVDLDPQGNATTGLGVGAEPGKGSYRLLTEMPAAAELRHGTAIPDLTIIPAEPDLAGAEVELVDLSRREFRLREALEPLRRTHPNDQLILIDCPPSLGLLTLNALVAADSVLIPLQCEYFALEGISQLLRTIELVRRRLNPGLAIEGILLTMYDRRNNLSDLVAADARGFFADQVYDTVIPRNVRLSEAPSHGKPVTTYDPRSPGALAYGRLALELLARQSVRGEQPG